MSDEMTLAAVAGVAVVGIFALKQIMGLAEGAGRYVGEQIERTTTSWQSILEGTGAPTIPETPAGYNPSNWMYETAGGVVWGVPAGMTPVEFCRSTGWATKECRDIRPWWDKVIGGDWYEIW